MSALRTISLRLRGTSVEILEEMGEETEGVVESTSKLQEKLKALTGVDILTDSGAYKDTYTILKEIGEVWEDLDPMDQAAALELMAGKNRANTLAAILNNMEDLEGAYESALGAEGSAMRENEAYLDSIQGRIDLFNNSVQTMWMNFLNTDVVKGIVDIGTALIKVVDQVGLLETAFIGLVGYLTFFKKVDWTKGLNLFGGGKKNNLLEGRALTDELAIFNAEFAKGPEAFGAYVQGAKKAGNGMDVLAAKVSDGTIKMRNGKVAAGDYTRALNQQSTAAQKAAQKQQLINLAIGLVIMAVSAAVSQFDSLADKIQDAEDRYEELQSTISSAEGDISSLTSELDTIQGKIDELSNKPLTIAEAEELQKLKEQSAELQKQKDLREQMLDAYKMQDEAASLEMFNKTIQTTAANQEKAAEAGKTWGKVIGAIGGALLAVGGIALAATGFGAAPGAWLASSGAMALIGAAGYGGSEIGGVLGENYAMEANMEKNLADWYESYATAISKANEDASKAEAEYLSNVTDANYDIWQKKLEAANTLQQELYTNLEKLQGYVSSLEYNDTTKATIDGFNSLMTKISLQGVGDDVHSKIDHIKSLEKEFNELSKGVDANGKNIALTADEYARYQSILSQILGITPSLVQGYNDEGNAIVKKNSLIAESIALLERQNKLEAQNLLINTDDNLISSYESAKDARENKMDAAKEVALPNNLAHSGVKITKDGRKSGYVNRIDKYIEDVIGVKKKGESLQQYIINNADAVYSNLDKILERAGQDKDGWAGLDETRIGDLALWFEQIRIQIEYADMAMSQFKQTLSIVPQASDYYSSLSGSHIQFINEYINSLDDLENLSDEEVAQIRDNIYALTNKIGQSEDLQNLINSLFEVDTDLAAQVYVNTINGILQQLVDAKLIDDKTKEQMAAQLVPDSKNMHTTIAEIKDKLADEYDAMADNLSFAELKVAYKFVADKESGSVTGEQLEAALAASIPESLTIISTYSELVEQATNYNEILQQTTDHINNNTKVTQEYKDSLEGLGISTEELAQCFDDENKLVVKNAALLNKLVKNAKNHIASNTKLAKSQAKLQYYELYKEMRRLTNGTKITDGTTLSYVNSLYEQMTALEQTIAKYSLLEAKLLGATNAYDQLEEAQNFDSEYDYGSKTEEMVNVLANAFNTAELGTQAAQVAIDGLIPDDVIDKTKALDDQMQQIYDYFTKGEVSRLFTIEFDDDGGISSVEMTKENVEAFTNNLIEAGEVFHGTWDEFTLDESITSLEDFAKAIGVTEEVAFAYLTELEKFDIGWLGGDYETLLDQLMSGDLEYAIDKNLQALADLEKRMANGEFDYEGGDVDYAKQRADLEKEFAVNQDVAREVVKKWSAATEQIETAQTRMNDLSDELAELDETDPEFKIKQDELREATKELYKTQALLNGLEEPTEVILQIASEDLQEEIKGIEDQLRNEGIILDDVVQFNKDTGKYEVVDGGTYTGKVDLTAYADLKTEQQNLNNLLSEGVKSTGEYLSNIDTTVAAIYSLLGGETTSGSNDTIDGGKKTADTVEVTAQEANVEGTDTGVSTDAVGQPYEDPAYATGGNQVTSDKNSESESKIANLSAQLKEAQDNVGQLEASIETLKAEKASIEADFNTAKTEAEAAISKLTNEKTAADETIAKLTAEIAALETAMNTAKAEADATIAKLTSEKSDLESSLEAAKAEYDASIAKLSAEKAELEESVAQLTASKSEADKTIAQLNADKASLETSIANANAVISQLETEKAELNAVIAESKANIETLKADKADVESDLAQAKEMLSQTEAMLAEAQGALDVANSDLAAANELITSLTTTNQNLESQVSNLSMQLDGANAALANAGAEKAVADATIAQLESALSAAEATIEALSAKSDTATSAHDGPDDDEEPEFMWWDAYGESQDIPAEVDLDTTNAEEELEDLGGEIDYSFSIGEILHDEGLDHLDLDKAFEKFGSSIIFDPTIFSQVLKEAAYAEEEINNLIDAIKTYENVVVSESNPDPLGLNNTDLSIESLKNALNSLGVAYGDSIGKWLDKKRELFIDVPVLTDVLKGQGWTDAAIQSYLSQLSSIDLGEYIINQSELSAFPLDALINKIFEIPEDKTTKYEVTGDGEGEVSDIGTEWAGVPETKTTRYTIHKTIIEETKKKSGGLLGGLLGGLFGGAGANGTAHAQGTAYKSGSWGAPTTETALTGELGPELRVRGNRWELLGENGAEFNEVKKGDIIFNHKQTEQLLSNGYITGRGKAFAEGNVGGAAFAGINTWDDAYGKFNESYSNTAGEELSDAAGDLSDAADEFREVFDWIEVRLEEINEKISLESAKLENAVGSKKQNAIIDDMIALNQTLYKNLTAGADKYDAYAKKLLTKIPEEYRKAAQDGSIAIEEFTGEVGEETLEAIQNYREWVQKGADATQQAEETLTEISNLAKQAIDNIAQEYENKASIPGIVIEQLEAYNALIETTQGAESAKIYEAMIKENNKQIGILAEQRNKMLSELNAQVEAGNIKKYSQAWYDAVGEIAAVDTEILSLTADTEGYQDTINELHWEHFDNLISRFEAISDEAENLIDILGSKDLVDKDTGEWTNEGITSLGLYAQQMEVAEMQAKKYKEEIQYLNKNWKKLGYTEQEYVEKLEELKNGQYDSIKAYNDTKKAIVDLTKARVDAIKEGIDKEIDAFEELISKKKEELSAEKDLYDFQKGVANQQKEIATIERKLAALSSDNSASARAKRAQLEAELAEARQELEDTYYDRSVSQQQEALDKELEAFQKEKEQEKEKWDEYLEDTEKVVADSLSVVQSNTEKVYNTLADMGKEYSLSIADALTSPWKKGEDAIQKYTDKFKLDMSKTVEELKQIAEEHKKLIDGIETNGSKDVSKVKDNAEEYTEAENGKNGSSGGDKSSAVVKVSDISGDIQYGQSGSNVKKLQKALNALGFNCGSADGIFGDQTYAAVMAFQKSSKFGGAISADGIVGPKTKKKFKVAGYAGGTTGVQTNQWALIDELGEELVIRPSKGRMTFLEKGSAVVPADLTSNLMEWGELDPSIMLERSKPVISASHVTNNNTEINVSFGEVVHIDTVTNETLPNLTKVVEKQLDKYMKDLNAQIRRKTNR